MPLFILFIIIPIIEITLLINVGQLIGAWYTVGLVLLSAFIGVNMLRYQGLATLARAQEKMRNGEMPGQEMIEGIVLAVGGALLITPGFFTDIIGFCCLVPFTRIAMVKLARSRFNVGVASAGMHGQTGFSSMHERSGQHSGGDVFEGEYHDATQERAPKDVISIDKPDENAR
ncbi:MAG: FxsA family protein [Pseudomonadales bacterium]